MPKGCITTNFKSVLCCLLHFLNPFIIYRVNKITNSEVKESGDKKCSKPSRSRQQISNRYTQTKPTIAPSGMNYIMSHLYHASIFNSSCNPHLFQFHLLRFFIRLGKPKERKRSYKLKLVYVMEKR